MLEVLAVRLRQYDETRIRTFARRVRGFDQVALSLVRHQSATLPTSGARWGSQSTRTLMAGVPSMRSASMLFVHGDATFGNVTISICRMASMRRQTHRPVDTTLRTIRLEMKVDLRDATSAGAFRPSRQRDPALGQRHASHGNTVGSCAWTMSGVSRLIRRAATRR